MARWICVDVRTVELARSESTYTRVGGCDVVDHDVEVELLGYVGYRPRRRTVIRNLLESQTRGAVIGSHDDPLVTAVGDWLPEHL